MSVNGAPELVFGIVGAVGAEMDKIAELLDASLQTVGYQTEVIRIIELAAQWPRYDWISAVEDRAARYNAKMDAGDDLRDKFGCGEALAMLAIAEIVRRRISFNKAREVS